MPTYQERTAGYEELLSTMRPVRTTELHQAARRIIENKQRYKAIEEQIGVPWDFIGVIHYRESNLNFEKHLHNGDSLTRRTYRVPAGRPKLGTPPFTWEESALDALKMKDLDKIQEWDDVRICYELERYNGWGYRRTKTLSPYLWGGSNHYTVGKYVKDGVYDPTHKDTQLGTVPLLMEVRRLERPTNEVTSASRKLNIFRRVMNSIVATVTSIFTLDNLNIATEYITKIKEFATSNAPLLVCGSVFGLYLLFRVIETYTIQDYREGRYIPSKESE